MVQNDTLAAALSKITQYEKLGRSEVTLNPSSSVIKKVLDLFKEAGYIESYEEKTEGNKSHLIVKLAGSINECGVIKPRFAVKRGGLERYEQRFLPSRDMGIMCISTTSGMIDHRAAKEKGVGGKLIAYCY